MIQALLLKVAALSLLLMLGQNPNLPEDFRAQATAVAQQALAASESAMLAPSPIQDTPAPVAAAPVVTNNPTPAPMPEPVSQARIEIISPIPSKGLGRAFITQPLFDERGELRNEVYIGAIVYNDAGAPVDNVQVTFTAGTSTPVVIQGTGNVANIYVDGQKRTVPYYPFSYTFTVPGELTITVAAIGKDASTVLTVQ